MQCIQMELYGSRRQNTHHRHGLPKPLRVARERTKQKPHRHDNPNVIEGIHRHEVSVKTIIGASPYHQLLAEFANLTRPPIFGKERTRHGVVHHIETTPGSPVYSKPRRLAPDRLKEVKMEGAYDCRRNFFYQQDSRPQRNTRTGLKNEWKRSGGNRVRVMAKGKFSFSKNWIPRLTFSYATTRRVALYSLNSMDPSKL